MFRLLFCCLFSLIYFSFIFIVYNVLFCFSIFFMRGGCYFFFIFTHFHCDFFFLLKFNFSRIKALYHPFPLISTEQQLIYTIHRTQLISNSHCWYKLPSRYGKHVTREIYYACQLSNIQHLGSSWLSEK